MSEASTGTAGVERIALQRAVAVIRPGSISVRRARGGILAPLIEAILAGIAVWVIVAYMTRLPLWVLMLLLVFVIIIGPVSVLGVVYQLVGRSFEVDRGKGTARWQQGFLGLGIGTREVCPFGRISHIEVRGDFEEELPGGDLQDVVRWQVSLVKDNGRVLEIASVIAARPLANEALERANRLAEAVAEMAGAEARPAALPAWALAEDDEDDGSDLDDRETIDG